MDKLKEAKERVYLKGFYEGVMLVGSCAGMKVCDAKNVIKQELIDRGEVSSTPPPLLPPR